MKIYSLQIKGHGASLNAYLNEYHLYSSPRASHSVATSLAPWLEKKNTARLVLSPSSHAQPGTPVEFSLAVACVENRERRPVIQMAFPGGVAYPDTPTLPFDSRGKTLAPGNALTFTCDDSAAVVEKPWNATPRTISSAAAVFQLFGQIQSAFLTGDIGALMNFSRARIAFGARLQQIGVPVFEQKVRRDLEATLAEKPQWIRFENLERQLTVHEFLPGKVVRLTDLEGKPALRSQPDADGIASGYDVVLAMTPGGLAWIM